MNTRQFTNVRTLLTCAAMFALILMAPVAQAQSSAPPKPVNPVCDMHQPGDIEAELLLALDNKPSACQAHKWHVNNDPSFRSWGTGGSMNLPVLTAAVGLFRSGPNVNLDYTTSLTAVPGQNGYQITYVNWWIYYLSSQVGENPATYLPTVTDRANPNYFVPPPARANLQYFKGTEEFSDIYDTSNVVAVIAVRYWVHTRGDQIPANKADALKRLTLKFLQANWALYGMAAGERPAHRYAMGWKADDSGNPLRDNQGNLIEARIPMTPVTTTDTQYDPTAPYKNGRLIYDGHFVALAGGRSKVGDGKWNYDLKFPLFDRAIEQLGVFIPQNNPYKEFDVLELLQSRWAQWSINQSPQPAENLYGLTVRDRGNLDALLHDCYTAPGTNPNISPTQICPDQSQPLSPAYVQNFRNWLANTYQPWLSSIHLATTYKILGGKGWRASVMEHNKNGNTTNFFAIYYDEDALDGGTHAQATFLFPWNDKDGAVPGTGSYDPATGRITATHDKVMKGPRTVHPKTTVFVDIPTETPLVQVTLTQDGSPVFNSSVVAKSLSGGFTPGGTAFGNDVSWVSSDVPEGSVLQSAAENWVWGTNPLPYTEAVRVHLSSPVAGTHQHFFSGATDSLTIGAGDTLYAYVYYETGNAPSEVMLQWFDGNWEHRAFWGPDLIPFGTPGPGHRYMGDLPAAGNWVRLEVPASLVGLEGRTITGMAFTLFNGQAAWDDAGKHTLVDPITNVAPGGTALQSTTYTGSPAGGPASLAVDGNTNGNWFGSSVTSTNYEYQPWWQTDLGDSYAIDSINVWNRSDCCADRLSSFYILVSDQAFASSNLASVLSQPGVTAYYVSGQGGYPTAQMVQRTGRYVRVQLTGSNYLSLAEVEVFGRVASSTTPPQQPGGLPASDVVWVEDSIPAGATTISGGWNWIVSSPSPVSGTTAHQQSALMSGPQQHFFYGTPNRLTINPGDKLFTYVYLDPQSPPGEIMLQWYDAGAAPGYEWEHRAYWGANLITQVGGDGSNSRRFMGALPPAGQWVRLEVPASQVGLEGRTISGMAFTQFDGIVTWDRSGKNVQSFPAPPPPGDNVWVEDSIPAGAVPYTNNDSWTWNSINPTPVSGSLANQSSNVAGMHQHYFVGASNKLSINVGDKLVAYVYIDPQHLPTEIMLQWHDSLNDWNHRAYWGADQLAYFGTRYYMGSLPAAGQWIRLEVPASVVGLEGSTIDGMAFTLFDGSATWDHGGKRP